MRKIIIAGHGNFAEGMRSSLELIMGRQEQVLTLCTYLKPENVEEKVDALMKQMSKEDEVVILTDLFGGSVNNYFLRYMQNPHTYLIAGVNLLLLIELVCRKDDDLEQVIETALQHVQSSIVYCNRYQSEETLSEF